MNLLSAPPSEMARRIAAAPLVTEEDWVAAENASVYVRRRYRPNTPAGNRPAILMVHGSSYPAEATFDLKLNGVSMMDALAAAGADVWLMDIAGYGASSRPPEMDGPAEASAPVSRTAEALEQVDEVVRHVLDRLQRHSLSLLGWSWGTTLMGGYAARRADRVAKLVQLAPQWLRSNPSRSDPGGPIGAYRVLDVASVAERWMAKVPETARRTLAPGGAVEALCAALLAADPLFSASHPGRFRAPNGTVADSREYWAAGKPFYDPARITCPVLVVHGKWDQELPLDMTRTYFAQLTGASYRKWVEISESTHSLILEKNRFQVMDAVLSFLGEDYTPEVSCESLAEPFC